MIKGQEIGPVKILFGRLPYYPYCNTLLLQDENTFLVDPACNAKTLQAPAQTEKILYLFNNHYHPDHIRFNDLFSTSIFLAHREEAPCFRSLDAMAEWVGVKGTEYEKNWRTPLDGEKGGRRLCLQKQEENPEARRR